MNAAVLKVVRSRQDDQDGQSMTDSENSPPLAREAAPATEVTSARSLLDASRESPCVLRVLNGANTGAESVLRSERLLIGNLENECDIVLDVGREERHACLVRVSSDGWTVLSIAGDLWVDREYVAAQQTRDVASGVVFTLGRVAFSIAHKESIDWSIVKPPFELVKPDLTGPIPTVALVPSRQDVMQKWHAVKLAAGIGMSALVLASAGAFVMNAWTLRTPTADAAVLQLKANQDAVKALPMGKELTVQPALDVPNKFLVQGYLPKRADAFALESAMNKAGINAEYHLVAVDEMATDLSKRFAEKDPKKIQYEKQGKFVVTSKSDQLDAQDRQARQAMQEIAALTALNLIVEDVLDQQGKPVVVSYERSSDRPGDLMVSDLDVIRQRQSFVVRELRLGKFPSVVMENGMRYFEGATLPDKSVLKQIGETALVLQLGRGERTIPLPAQVLVTSAQAESNVVPANAVSRENQRK